MIIIGVSDFCKGSSLCWRCISTITCISIANLYYFKNIFSINGLVKIGENHHYTFEDYQGTQIEINREDYIDVLKTTETMDVNSINRLAVLNAFKVKRL